MHIGKKLEELRSSGEVCFSYEFFCPDSDLGFEELRPRLDRMASTEPAFVDIVHCGGLESARRALRLCRYVKKVLGIPSLLHVPCADMSVDDVRTLLDEAKTMGVTNVLVERGVPMASGAIGGGSGSGTSSGAGALERPPFTPHPTGFTHPADLVAFIRSEYGGQFAVGVMAYPCGSGEYPTLAEDLAQLRAKQDAGADFAIAQHVNEARVFADFRDRAAALGVTLPLAASLMPVHGVDAFAQTNAYCGVPVPPALAAALESLRCDEKAVREYGLRHAAALGRDLFASGVPVVHLHTLNLETTIRSLLQELGLHGPGAASRRKLPWRPSGDECRASEDVRPIYWANRPASYVERTAGWQQYPSGRWATAGGSGGAEARPFVDVPADYDALAAVSTSTTKEERRAMWGEAPTKAEDVWNVFALYIEGRVPRLPWCDVTLHPETNTISARLARINRGGFLTINSQPRVNAARSDDPTFGWGGIGGYVYQKAYVECFASPANLAALMSACARHPSITYQAVDARGNTYSNYRGRGAQAVTWGVFPAREIIQPTVVDPEAFLEWKKEAFALWLSQWGNAYDDDTASGDLIADIHDSYYLINVVDNDFIAGDIFAVFDDAIARLASPAGSGGPCASTAPGMPVGAAAAGAGPFAVGVGGVSAAAAASPASTSSLPASKPVSAVTHGTTSSGHVPSYLPQAAPAPFRAGATALHAAAVVPPLASASGSAALGSEPAVAPPLPSPPVVASSPVGVLDGHSLLQQHIRSSLAAELGATYAASVPSAGVGGIAAAAVASGLLGVPATLPPVAPVAPLPAGGAQHVSSASGTHVLPADIAAEVAAGVVAMPPAGQPISGLPLHTHQAAAPCGVSLSGAAATAPR